MAPFTAALKVDRHCAFCLNPVPREQVCLCDGKCRRRAYCSEECRERDWINTNSEDEEGAPPQLRGQGHKNWCTLATGEEDLDWKVAEVEGKGLGLLALRDFPKGSRIVVEAGQLSPYSHPKVAELTPHTNKDAEGRFQAPTEAELKTKFDLNCLEYYGEEKDKDGKEKEKKALFLRMARANHNCFPNAEHFYDREREVKILYATEDILKGSEITISYIHLTAFNADESVTGSSKRRHRKLRSKWGFACPNDAPCRSQTVQKKITQATKLYKTLPVLARSNHSMFQALDGVRKLLGLCEDLKQSQMVRQVVLYGGFLFSVSRKATLGQAEIFMAELCDLLTPILHPEDGWMKACLGWREDLRRHEAYLFREVRSEDRDEELFVPFIHMILFARMAELWERDD